MTAAAIDPPVRPRRKKRPHGTGSVQPNGPGWRWMVNRGPGQRFAGRTMASRELAEADLARWIALPPAEQQAALCKPRVCKRCAQPGHGVPRCPLPKPVRARPVRAKPARPPEPEVRAEQLVAPLQPEVVRHGQRYVVGEALVEELDGVAQVWLDDETWEAIAPAGREVDGHQLWLLRRVEDGDEQIGAPQLWPFIRETPGPLPPVVRPLPGEADDQAGVESGRRPGPDR